MKNVISPKKGKEALHTIYNISNIQLLYNQDKKGLS